MKKYIPFTILVSLLFLSCDSVRYIGKTYLPTTTVDIYYGAHDIKKDYEVIGKASNAGNNLEKNQTKILDEAKKRGADGIVYSDMQNTTSVAGGYSATSDVLNADFIKYK